MIRRDLSSTDMHCFRSDHELWREIQQAREKADQKHGENGIERLPVDSPNWLPILVEEVGELAQAQTYDKGSRASLRSELIDVCSVASAWIAALDKEREDGRRA